MCCKLCSLSCANLHRPFSGAVNEQILLACTFRAARCFTTNLHARRVQEEKDLPHWEWLENVHDAEAFLVAGCRSGRRQAIGVLATEIHIPRNSKIFSHPRRVPLKDGTVFIVFPLRTLMVIYSYIY